MACGCEDDKTKQGNADPQCAGEKGQPFKVTVKKFKIQGKGDDDAKTNALTHVMDQIKDELNKNGVKCDLPCETGECYVDIDPSVEAHLSTPKPILKHNPGAKKKFEEAYVCGMPKDVEFTVKCDCALIA
jgi:hypothetical protein